MSQPVSPASSVLKSTGVWVLSACIFIVAYFVLAKLSHQTAILAGCIGLFSLQAGLALAAVYRFGPAFAFVIIPASFLSLQTDQQWPVALGIAIGDAVAAFLAVHFLRSRPFSPEFILTTDVNRFLAVCSLTSLIDSFNAGIWLCGSGRISDSQIASAIGLGFLGDLAGIIILAPLLLSTLANRKTIFSLGFVQSTLALLVLLSVIAFAPLGPIAFLFVFLPFLLIVRVAAHHGLGAAGWHFLVLTMLVLAAQITGNGPGEQITPTVRPFGAWGFLTALGLTILYTTGLIGELNNYQRRLVEGEENYKALVEDNPALIVRFSLDGRLAFANETFRRVFGIRPGMTAGANFYELTGTNSDARFLSALQAMHIGEPGVTAESSTVIEYETHWFRWTARVVSESSGVGLEFHAVGLDVTGQKKAEAERRRIESQAVQVQKLESVGLIAGGIAHEFNGIFTAMMGHLEVARTTLPVDAETHGHLDEVKQSARRAADLTQQLLSFTGQRVLPPGPLDLAEVIRGTAELFSVAVPKSCTVRLELAEGLPLISADEVRLRQLLMCLMANAGEAVCENGGTVTLRLSAVNVDPKTLARWRLKGTLEAGAHVLLEVEDGGIGMSPAVLARVFEPFFSARFPGRGLGLAAALGIARDYSAALGVCSRPGFGTRVSVLFPALDACTAGLSTEPVHRGDCRFCQSYIAAETPAEGFVGLPPSVRSGTARTGWSSIARGRASRWKPHEV